MPKSVQLQIQLTWKYMEKQQSWKYIQTIVQATLYLQQYSIETYNCEDAIGSYSNRAV